MKEIWENIYELCLKSEDEPRIAYLTTKTAELGEENKGVQE